MSRTITLAATLVAVVTVAIPAFAWTPTKPIEFIATAGPGGGTDNFTRAVQAAIVKNKLVDVPIVVVNKPGAAARKGSPTPRRWWAIVSSRVRHLERLVAADGLQGSRSTTPTSLPVAAMVQDEFLLWVKQDAPYQNVQDYLKAMQAKNGFREDGGRSIEGHRRDADTHDRQGGRHQVYLHPVQERRRSRGAACRRPCRQPRQQSERERRPVEGRHAAADLRVQHATPAGGAEDHGDAGLARHPDLPGGGTRDPSVPAAAHHLVAAEGDAPSRRNSMST